jgi:hypothetical protein
MWGISVFVPNAYGADIYRTKIAYAWSNISGGKCIDISLKKSWRERIFAFPFKIQQTKSDAYFFGTSTFFAS